MADWRYNKVLVRPGVWKFLIFYQGSIFLFKGLAQP